jgi:hypothetical protein
MPGLTNGGGEYTLGSQPSRLKDEKPGADPMKKFSDSELVSQAIECAVKNGQEQQAKAERVKAEREQKRDWQRLLEWPVANRYVN